MALQHVYQPDTNGCFVAAVAMIMGKTYRETLQLVFPHHDPSNILSDGLSGMDITQTAMDKMRSLGIKVRLSKYEQLRSVLKYGKRNALIILRWKWDPEMCHAVVFDAETKTILDPADYSPRTDRTKYPKAHIESIMWVDAPPNTRLEKDNAKGRDEQRDQRTTFHPSGTSAVARQALRIASAYGSQWGRHLYYSGGDEEACC